MQDKFSSGELVPGWASVASIDLIRHSAYELYAIAVKKNWSSVVIPRPGCGAGELDWFSVKAVLDRALDSRFYVITF